MSKSVIFILGPTATGKSKLALRTSLVDRIPIVNGDSIQIYKGLKIGSALPSREDLQLTPHHLYAYVDKGKTYTAAHYVSDVGTLLKENKNQEQWILCGGSGFYIQALEKGMFPVAPVTPEIKKAAEEIIAKKGWEKTREWLVSQDPGLEKKVHVNDQYRINRALEIYLISQKSHGELKEELRPSPFKDYAVTKVGLTGSKEKLRERVVRRVKEMLDEGFVEEVEGLLNEGLESWSPLSSVGYREVKDHLQGTIAYADLHDAIVLSHMQLIKKQMTWFKKDESIQWFDTEDLAAAHNLIKSRLEQH